MRVGGKGWDGKGRRVEFGCGGGVGASGWALVEGLGNAGWVGVGWCVVW